VPATGPACYIYYIKVYNMCQIPAHPPGCFGFHRAGHPLPSRINNINRGAQRSPVFLRAWGSTFQGPAKGEVGPLWCPRPGASPPGSPRVRAKPLRRPVGSVMVSGGLAKHWPRADIGATRVHQGRVGSEEPFGSPARGSPGSPSRGVVKRQGVAQVTNGTPSGCCCFVRGLEAATGPVYRKPIRAGSPEARQSATFPGTVRRIETICFRYYIRRTVVNAGPQ
jgi:hypothetical protein